MNHLSLYGLSNWQLIGVGVIIAALFHLLFSLKGLRGFWRKEVDTYHARRALMHERQTSRPAVPKSEIPSHLTSSNAILSSIESTACIIYREWYHLSERARWFLCLPACAALIILSFCFNYPIILGASSFYEITPLVYIAKFITVLMIYICIYLLMSRFRFLISFIFVLNMMIFPFALKHSNPGISDSDFGEMLFRSISHLLAFILIVRAWVQSRHNRPGAIFKFLGLNLFISGICNAWLAVFMIMKASSLAENQASHLLSAPIYHFFEPILNTLMTPLHLHIGDFTPENLMLAVLLFAWSGLLFCIGGFLSLARYDAIALIPEEVEGLKIYT